MDQHIRCRKSVDIFIKFDSEYLMLFYFLLFGSCGTVIKGLRHSAHKERTASAARIEYYRALVHAGYLRHEVSDMVRGKGLVLVGFPNVFVKRYKEQIKKVLPRCALIINKRQNVVFNERKNFSERSDIQLTDILIVEDVSVEQRQLLCFVDIGIEQPFKDLLDTGSDFVPASTMELNNPDHS